MSTAEHYQAIVIGSGQGGTPLCRALAEAGLRTALIERQHVGGTCVNEGCTPTKTMVASARVAYLSRRGANYGVPTGDIRIDMPRVRQRKRDIVDSFRNGSQGRLEKTKNLDLLFGEASFTSANSILLRSKDSRRRTLSAERIFINAGCRPAVPALDGLKDVPFLDSTSIMELDTVPEHLLVLGGGYVGLEFGQMFRRFGSRVTIAQSGSQLLAREDSDVAEEVAAILKQDAIDVLLNAKAERVAKAGAQIQLTIRAGNGSRTLEGSHLLVAAGRVPNTDTLNVSAAGLRTNRRSFLTVNSKLETNVAGVYALGDIKGEPAFTHISYNDYQIVWANLIDGKNQTTENRYVPYAVFTDPQLGRVGLTEKEAREKKYRLKIGTFPMAHVSRAIERDETAGMMKLIVNAADDRILGAAILATEGGELVQLLGVTILAGAPYTLLKGAVYIHPTLAEGFFGLMDSVKPVD